MEYKLELVLIPVTDVDRAKSFYLEQAGFALLVDTPVGEEIICQVRDQGWIADPLAGRQRRSPEDSGHGLWVVNQVCDLVEIRTSPAAGTIIRLHMCREDG